MNPIYYYKLKPSKKHHKLRRKVVEDEAVTGWIAPIDGKLAEKNHEPLVRPVVAPGLPRILALHQGLDREFEHLYLRQQERQQQQRLQNQNFEVKWPEPSPIDIQTADSENSHRQSLQFSYFQTNQLPPDPSRDLLVVDASTADGSGSQLPFVGSNFNLNHTMWPYQSYKPISWDKYYAHDLQDKHVSITSGLAAGITIGVFFAVFLLTFGCRLYSQRVESGRQRNHISSRRRLSVSDLLGWPTTPCQPPPPYEVAIRLPPAVSPTSPPPFTGDCCSAAPTYEDSCRDSPCSDVTVSSTLTSISSIPERRLDNLPPYSERTPPFSPVYTV